MKVTKNGNVKLEKGEVRIGNFFVRDEGENEHIRLTDLNSCFTIRVDKKMPLGIWLDNILKMGERGHESIKTFIAVMWSLLSVAPDQEFVEDVLGVSDRALRRHPDWYGYNPDESDEANDAAAQEVREMKEFEEDLKNIPDGEGKETADDGEGQGEQG